MSVLLLVCFVVIAVPLLIILLLIFKLVVSLQVPTTTFPSLKFPLDCTIKLPEAFIFVAIPFEIRPILLNKHFKVLGYAPLPSGGKCWIGFWRTPTKDTLVALVLTGAGPQKAAVAVKDILECFPLLNGTPNIVALPWFISCGLSGALDSNLKIGDVVCAEVVVNATTSQRWPLRSADKFFVPERKQFISKPALVTSVDFVASAEDRQHLHSLFPGSVVVDMETSALAAALPEALLRNLFSVRSVSDCVPKFTNECFDFVELNKRHGTHKLLYAILNVKKLVKMFRDGKHAMDTLRVPLENVIAQVLL